MGRVRRVVRAATGRVSWAITGLVAGGVVAAYLVGKTKTEEIAAVAVGLLVTLLFVHAGEMFEASVLRDLLSGYLRAREEPELQDSIESIITSYGRAREYRNILFSRRAARALATCRDELGFLADGRLKTEPHEDLSATIDAVDFCRKSLRASSWQDTLEYWRSAEGRAYLTKQKQFLESSRDHSVTRVFIFDRSQLDGFRDVMYEQQRLGIEVLFVDAADTPPELLEAYVLYDDKIVRLESFVGGVHKRAVFSLNVNEAREYDRRFSDLRFRSQTLEEVFPEGPDRERT